MKKLILNSLYFVCFSMLLFSCVDEDGTVRPDGSAITNSRVDLRPLQTSLKNQGGRNTCITFSAVAAMEAAYKRAGYGTLDLSEEFTNFFGKTFWLHPNWSEVLARDAQDPSESQLGAFGGGGGAGYVEFFANGLRIPLESAMPYRTSPYSTAEFPSFVSEDWTSPLYNKQRNHTGFNLDPAIMSTDVIKAPNYYSVNKYVMLKDPKSVAEIEGALKLGLEVVWDFLGVWPTGTDSIWRACDSCPLEVAHSMLIVGFDKSHSDPARHYFIVKNSWGGAYAGRDGFSYISYDYIKYGTSGAYILSVNPPKEWPELAFMGKWKLNFDGWKGELNIYHMPGVSQKLFNSANGGIVDRRIGSFYDSDGKAYRVNGIIQGNKIEFYINGTEPLMRWDKLEGRRFTYYLAKDKSLNFMAGLHKDPDSNIYAGYATKSSYLTPGAGADGSVIAVKGTAPEWKLKISTAEGIFKLSGVDNSFLSEAEKVHYNGFVGTFTETGSSSTQTVYIKQEKNAPGLLIFTGITMNGTAYELTGKPLNWEKGVVTGQAKYGDQYEPFSMVLM